MPKITKKILESGLKQGTILDIKVSSRKATEVLEIVNSCLDNKEKFYIVTTNPEIILRAKDDWLLKKSIHRSKLSLPVEKEVGYAFNYLFKLNVNIHNKKDLFWNSIKILDERGLRACLLGDNDSFLESIATGVNKNFKNLTFKTYKTPKYNKRGQPDTLEDRKMHKSLLGKVKIFEPDFVFVSMDTPKQEKWIYRNFFRLKAIGAFACGEVKSSKLQSFFEKYILFPLAIFLWKLNPPRRLKKKA